MFGFGKELVVDEELLKQQRASIKPNDPRESAGVARVFRDKSDQVRQNEAAQQDAEQEVVELLGELESVETAIKKMDKGGFVVPAKVTRNLGTVKSRLTVAREREERVTRITKAGRENLNNWLAEGNPTNRELIELDRA